MKRIIALIFHEFGNYGFEKDFDTRKSVENYIKDFEQEVKRNVPCNYPKTFTLAITVHKKDGSFLRDHNGRYVTDRIYINPEMQVKFSNMI